MIDIILADELRPAGTVLLVQADDPRRQRHAQVACRIIPEDHHHLHRLFLLPLVIPLIEPPGLGIIDHEFLAQRHGAGFKQAHLLGLIVLHRGLALKVVKMILKERFLLEGRALAHAFHHHHIVAPAAPPVILLRPVHLARNQFQLRVLVRSAAFIIKRDPTGKVASLIRLVKRQHIIRPPVDIVGHVCNLNILPAFILIRVHPC